MEEFEGCKRRTECRELRGKIEVTTEELINRTLKKHWKKEPRPPAPERSRDASVEATGAEGLHCIYIALSTNCPKAIRSARSTVRVWAPTPSTNTHLASSRKTPHPVSRTFTRLFSYQSLRRAALHHLLCPKTGVKLRYVVVVQQERLQGAFNGGKGKPVTTEAGSWCSRQIYPGISHFLLY